MWKSWGYTSWVSSFVGHLTLVYKGTLGEPCCNFFSFVWEGKSHISWYQHSVLHLHKPSRVCLTLHALWNGLISRTICSGSWKLQKSKIHPEATWASVSPECSVCLSDLFTQPGNFHVPEYGQDALQICSIHGQMSTWLFLCPALLHCVLCHTPTLVASVCITSMALSCVSAFMVSNFSHFCFSQYWQNNVSPMWVHLCLSYVNVTKTSLALYWEHCKFQASLGLMEIKCYFGIFIIAVLVSNLCKTCQSTACDFTQTCNKAVSNTFLLWAEFIR